MNQIIGGACATGLAGVAVVVATASPAQAATRTVPAAYTANWCSAHGATFARWAGSAPNIAICGPGPEYGGGWNYINVPGPAGTYAGYQNATPGFQCVELAERYLALAYGFSAVHANGAQVAMNYHAAYPRTTLVMSGSSAAVGHAPVAGDVVSLSSAPSFQGGDGHVAIVVASSVDGDGNGTVTVAQENVSSSDYIDSLSLVGWRLVDPSEPSNAEFQYHYAEWLHVNKLPAKVAAHSSFLPKAKAGVTHASNTSSTSPVSVNSRLPVVLASFHRLAIPGAHVRDRN